jgi:hypothetical protein
VRRAGLRALVALGVFLVLLVVGLAGGVVYLEGRPQLVASGIERALRWPEGSVQLEQLDLRWPPRVAVWGLSLQPPEPHAPAIHIVAAEADLPALAVLWQRQEVHLGDVVVEGLSIRKPDQHPPRELELPLRAPVVLRADHVLLLDASFHAPADGIMSEVEATGIQVEAVDVRWVPGMRQLSAVGRAFIERLQLGAIDLHTVRAEELSLDRTRLDLPRALVGYGESTVSVAGHITAMDTKPAVELEVLIEEERVENAVATALGHSSPLRGFLQARVVLRSGGDLPRGGARFEGILRLRRAEVFLGQDLKMLPRVLIDIAPWFRRQDSGWLEAGTLVGQGRFGRGWVELSMERPSRTHRVLQAWGRLDAEHIDLTVRAVPKRGDDRPGVGVKVSGTVKAPKLRLAKRDELRLAPSLITQ